jgi:hypothetical protein
MRNIVISFAVVIGLFSCKRYSSTNNDLIKLNNTIYSGCFDNYTKSLKSITDNQTDSVFYEINNDTLYLRVCLNYTCCGLLNDSTVIDKGNFKIYISDTCKSYRLCNCICNFRYTYMITNFVHKNLNFKVCLKRFGEKEYSFWKETKFIDGLD